MPRYVHQQSKEKSGCITKGSEMNRGTALKWLDILKSGRYEFGNGQMRYENQFDPLGVLADFLDPDAWKSEFIGYSWNGETFKLPDEARKKCKIKTPYMEFVHHNSLQPDTLVDVIDRSSDWTTPIYFIEMYYEQF